MTNCGSKFPHIIKAGNAVVKIYRGKARGYDLFTVVHYRDGVRRRHTFGKYANARSHAQEVATQIARGQLNVLSLTNSDRDNYVAAMNLLEPFGIPPTQRHRRVRWGTFTLARRITVVGCEGTRNAPAACH
jgi:hypothetical protein